MVEAAQGSCTAKTAKKRPHLFPSPDPCWPQFTIPPAQPAYKRHLSFTPNYLTIALFSF